MSWSIAARAAAMLAFIGCLTAPAQAHEMRPSLLTMTEQDGGRIAVQFNIGFAKGTPMPLKARLPSHCTPVGTHSVRDADPIRTVRWVADCGDKGLNGNISVEGLSTTRTDVMVRTPGGVVVLRPQASSAPLPGEGGRSHTIGSSVLGAYIGIGVEHIWLGPDHLAFVLGLLFLVGRRWKTLLTTLTAFTLAHSVTLALSTLELVRLPSRMVEALIAASIVLLAHEVTQRGPERWAVRAPWSFALVCGLLHGFGFAGVLADVGLPSDEIPAALLGFNIGVELGQVAFVNGVIGLGLLAQRMAPVLLNKRGFQLSTYAIGALGAYWFWGQVIPIITDVWRTT